VLKNLFGRINLFAKIKAFLDANPQRAKLISVVAIALIIPLTVIAALTVQNLKQRAGGGSLITISDAAGNNAITETSNPNVFIGINIFAAPDWVLPNQPSANNDFIKNAYAQGSDSQQSDSQESVPQPFLETPTLINPAGGGNATTISSIIDNPTAYLGQKVTIGGTYRGWTGGHGTPPITRSDWLLQDATGYIYVTGNTFGMNAMRDLGKSITVTGVVKVTGNNNAYLDASKQALDSTPTPTPVSPTLTLTPTMPPTPSATSTPVPTSEPSPTPTPTPSILRAIYLENMDTDGSTGGSSPLRITVNSITDITHIAWKLNDLLPGQTQTPRVVRVTLIGDTETAAFATTINLFKPESRTDTLSRVELSLFKCTGIVQVGQDCQMSALAYDTANLPMSDNVTYTWGISSASSVGTLNQTNGNITNFSAQNVGAGDIWVLAQHENIQAQKSINIQVELASKSGTPKQPTVSTPNPVKNIVKQLPNPTATITINADLNTDGTANCKDMKILVSQFGQKGTSLTGDLNHDGLVNGIDYNTILRNYTPGDTTLCSR